MATVKYANNHGWDFGMSSLANAVPQTKEASIRSQSEALDYACGLDPRPGHTNIIVIAMGCTESYGPNRNADGFSRGMLKQYHPTFERFGHVFVNHKNKDPKKSYGDILKSFYNDDMDRVELVISLDNDKSSRYIDRIYQGRPLPVSMGIHIPFDVCNICSHRAPTTKQWCKHMQRRGAFGPNTIYYVDEDDLEQYPDKDGHLIFVHNPSGKFFDISIVTRPADQTAYMIYGPNALKGGRKMASFLYDPNGNPIAIHDTYQEKLADYMGSAGERALETPMNEDNLATDRPSNTPDPHGYYGVGGSGQKAADMIKRVDGMGVSLKEFMEDPKNISEQKAALLVSRGLGRLSDTMKRANIRVSFPEVFKLAYTCMFDALPSQEEFKAASLYQSEFVGYIENNPNIKVFVKKAFDLGNKAEQRHVAYLKRMGDSESGKPMKFAEFPKASRKHAGMCGLVAATIFSDQSPGAEEYCRGRAYTYHLQDKLAVDSSRQPVSMFSSSHEVFDRVSNIFGNIIF